MKGCFGKILTVVLCVLLGVVLTVGGVVGAGYYILTKEGSMGTVAEYTDQLGLANEDGTPMLNFSDETKAMSILDWGEGLIEKISDIDNATIGDLEDYIGITTISDAIYNVIGISPNATRSATFSTLGETLTSELTLSLVSEKFGVELPESMPIFTDETFLNTPLTEAFGNLSGYTLGDFILIEDSASSVLKELRDTPIDNIADKISTLTIGDIIETTEDTSPIIKALSDLTIDDLGTDKFQNKINGIKLSDVMTDLDEETSNSVLYSLKDCTIGDLQGSAADKKIKSMFLCDIMTIDDTSTATLKALKYACIESQYADIEGMEKGASYALGTLHRYLYQDTVLIDGQTYYRTYYYKDGVTYSYDKLENGYYSVKEGDTTYYLLASDGTADTEAKTVTTDNRYCFLYDADGNAVKTAGTPDEGKIAYLLIPDFAVTANDTEHKIITAHSYYQFTDGTKTKAYDAKIVKTGKTEDTQLNLYEYKPLIGINEKIETLSLGDVVDITESSPLLLKSIKDNKITELDTVVDTLLLSEVVEIGDASPLILRTLKNKNTTVTGIGNVIDDLLLSEVIEIDSSSAKILQTLSAKNTKINDMGSAISDLTIGDAVEIGDTSPQILKTLKDTKITQMGDKLNGLKLNEVFDEDDLSQGVLSLINPETELDNISTAVAAAVQKTSVAVLVQTGVIDNSSFADMKNISDDGVKAFIYNSSMTDMMKGLIKFVSEPVVGLSVNYAAVSPNSVAIAGGSYSSLTDFVAEYSQYDVINFTGDVTVSVDETEDAKWAVKDENGNVKYYAIPLYCVGSEDYTVTYTYPVGYAGGAVRIAIYQKDGETYTYSKQQAGYHFDKYAKKHSTSYVNREAGIVISFE